MAEQMRRILLTIAILVAACGGTSGPDTTPAPTSTVPSVASTTSNAPSTTATITADAAPLESYRFALTLAVEPEGGQASVVDMLRGERTLAPEASRIFGTIGSEMIDLVTDGEGWWDLVEPELEVTAEDVALFLTYSGFIQPADIAGLLADDAEWEDLGTEMHLDAPAMHLRRTSIAKDVDWELGDVAQMDVWRSPNGDVVRLIARWATGDNSGFPISTWEITERNPGITIPIPGSG